MAELSIGIGLFINIVFVEVIGIAAGGMVVPGYIALHLDSPLNVLSTVLVAFATFGMVRFLSRFLIIYGHRHLMFSILTGFLLTRAFNFASDQGLFLEASLQMRAIGMIVPGLIAYWMERQGVLETICGLVIGSVTTRFILIMVLGGEFSA